jgi:hypothetical protein
MRVLLYQLQSFQIITNKFVKSYEFDLIFITEYIFFYSVIKNAFYDYNNCCIFSNLTIFRVRGAKNCTLHFWGGIVPSTPPPPPPLPPMRPASFGITVVRCARSVSRASSERNRLNGILDYVSTRRVIIVGRMRQPSTHLLSSTQTIDKTLWESITTTRYDCFDEKYMYISPCKFEILDMLIELVITSNYVPQSFANRLRSIKNFIIGE